MRKLCIFILFICLIFCNWQSTIAESNNELLQAELEIVRDQLREESEKSLTLEEKLHQINQELDAANTTISELKSEEYMLIYVGEFKITYYCDERRNHICGGNGVTASGKPTEVGWSVAADWDVLPKGSLIYVDGIGFREVQDTGSAVKNKHIDVLVKEHQEALNLGVDHEDVWIVIKKNS